MTRRPTTILAGGSASPNPKDGLLAHLARICGVQAQQCQVGSTPHLQFGRSLLTTSAGNTCQVTSHAWLKGTGRRYWVGRR